MLEEKEQPFQLDRVSIRLVKDAPLYSEKPMSNPMLVVEALGKELCEMDREVMYVINVKTNSVPINCSVVSIGTLNSSLVEPRELFKSSILSNAAAIILLHNHPSGSVTPSPADIKVTRKIEQALDLLEIKLSDHIIVGSQGKTFSFLGQGIIGQSIYEEGVAEA